MELMDQKEEYGRLLREENSKCKIEREKLESEISKLKKTPNSTSIVTNHKTHDADLTAFIKDLKESANNLSNGLSSSGKSHGKRAGSSSSANSNRIMGNNVKDLQCLFYYVFIFRNVGQLPHHPKIVKSRVHQVQ